MKTSMVLSCLLVLGACASDEHSRRPAATVDTEPQRTAAQRAEAAEARRVRNDADPDRRDVARTSEQPHVTADVDRAERRVVDAERRPLARTDHDEPSDKDRHDGLTAVAPAASHTADNTGINQRDVDRKTLTPLDQRENSSDLDVTQRIRQAMMSDDSLSFTAKNAKIITADGRVTLRGPVKSVAERAAIAAHANRIAGAGRVDNQLEVAK